MGKRAAHNPLDAQQHAQHVYKTQCERRRKKGSGSGNEILSSGESHITAALMHRMRMRETIRTSFVCVCIYVMYYWYRRLVACCALLFRTLFASTHYLAVRICAHEGGRHGQAWQMRNTPRGKRRDVYVLIWCVSVAIWTHYNRMIERNCFGREWRSIRLKTRGGRGSKLIC